MDRDLPEHHVLLRRYDDLLVVVQGVRVHAPGPERRLIVRGGHHVDRQSSGARRWSRRAGRPPLEVAARHPTPRLDDSIFLQTSSGAAKKKQNEGT